MRERLAAPGGRGQKSTPTHEVAIRSLCQPCPRAGARPRSRREHMTTRSHCLLVHISVLILALYSFADFKYTQQSKVTGGALISMTKTLGVFSKSARNIDAPQTSVTMLKGNRLRQEHADGQIQIIDLDEKRFVYIDPANKTYSTMTFDEFKAAMQRAAERAKEEQAKQMKGHPEAHNVNSTPT